MPAETTILLADDDSLVRVGLRAVLDAEDDNEVFTLPFSPHAMEVTGLSEETLLAIRVEAFSYLEEACGFLISGSDPDTSRGTA